MLLLLELCTMPVLQEVPASDVIMKHGLAIDFSPISREARRLSGEGANNPPPSLSFPASPEVMKCCVKMVLWHIVQLTPLHAVEGRTAVRDHTFRSSAYILLPHGRYRAGGEKETASGYVCSYVAHNVAIMASA